MQMLDGLTKRVVWSMVALAGISCGSSSSSPTESPKAVQAETSETIDIASTWASAGQVELFQRLVDIHKSKHPNDNVYNSAIASTDWQGELEKLVAQGKSPDLYVQQSSQVASFIQANGADALQPLDDYLSLASPSEAAVLPNIEAELKADVTVNGKLYGLPVGTVVRVNGLYYNKRVFAANQLSLPTTVDEFMATCSKLKAAGVYCVTGSFMTILFEDLLAGTMGADAYFTYRRNGSPDESTLRKAIDTFGDVIDNYADPNLFRGSEGMYDVIQSFMSGQTAMYHVGDWMNETFVQLGWSPGVDYEVAAAPGSAGLFVYSADVWTVLRDAPNLQGAFRFLTTSLSTEGQLAMTYVVPARRDVELPTDPVKRSITDDWRQAKRRLAANANFVWEGPLQAFAHTKPHDKEALVQALLTVY